MTEKPRKISKRTRASVESLRRLLVPTQPGVLGELSAIIGRDRHGEVCRIEPRDNDAYFLVAGDGDTWPVKPEEIMRMFLDGDFLPQRVEMMRDLTPRLFRAAVNGAQSATSAELRAVSGIASIGTPREDADDAEDDKSDTWFELMMVWTDQDAALSPSLEAVVFAVATAEAQVNAWGRWAKGDPDDKRAVDEKCKLLAEGAEIRLEFGGGLGARFLEAVERRHEIVHARPIAEEFSLIGKDLPTPASTEASMARNACCGVRWVLVTLARALNLEPPRYLAMCPPSPNDLDAWRSAILLTGMRDDPDFPPLYSAAVEIWIYRVAGREPFYDEGDQTQPELRPGLPDAFGWELVWTDLAGVTHRFFDSGAIYESAEDARREVVNAQSVDSELGLVRISPDVIDRLD